MFGRLRKAVSWYLLYRRAKKAWKETMTMDDKPVLKSMTNWGMFILALVPISSQLLPMIGAAENRLFALHVCPF